MSRTGRKVQVIRILPYTHEFGICEHIYLSSKISTITRGNTHSCNTGWCNSAQNPVVTLWRQGGVKFCDLYRCSKIRVIRLEKLKFAQRLKKNGTKFYLVAFAAFLCRCKRRGCFCNTTVGVKIMDQV